MTQLVKSEDKYKGLRSLLLGGGMQQQLKLACTRNVTPERMARIALTELRRTPKLMNCSQESFLGALMQCAQYGLEPGPMGLAYLIPYGNECQFQVGYKGLLQLAWRSEQISSIQSEVVYSCDHFEFSNGIPPSLKHVPVDTRPDDAVPTHTFCVIGTTSGGWIFRVMTTGEVEKIRKDHAKDTRKDSAWVTAWDEMACKTVMKRTCKRAPVSSEVLAAIALDDMSEIGMAQNLGADITIDQYKTDEGEEIDPDTGEVLPPASDGGPYEQ